MDELFRPSACKCLPSWACCAKMVLFVVGVAEWLRHLVVAQKTVGSNPIAHPEYRASQSSIKRSGRFVFFLPTLSEFWPDLSIQTTAGNG